MPVCMDQSGFDQANLAKERDDARAMRYLIDKGQCFYLKPDTKYSVIEINNNRNVTDWVKIRVYTGEGNMELFSWYGFVASTR